MNSTAYFADDVATSQKTVGWSLVTGTLLVTLLYLLLNVVFLLSAPVEDLRGVLDVGTVVATHLIGTAGGKAMALLIAGGLVAGVSGMTWIGPRITQVMGQNLPALFWFSQTSSNNIPWRATLLQYGFIIVVLLTSSFKMLLIATQIPILICALLGVLGIMVLRRREKINSMTPNFIKSSPHQDKDAPFALTCPFYPVPPLVFATISIAALIYTITTNLQDALWGFSLILLGLILHPVFKMKFGCPFI